MLEEFRNLLKKYIDAYWQIKDEVEAIPAEQREAMQTELLKQFNRDCAQLEGADGLIAERRRAEHENTLKEIEEQKKLRNAEIDAEYRLKHVQVTQETDLRSAEAVQKTELSKHRIECETARLKNKIKLENDVLEETDDQIYEIKSVKMVPKKKAYRRWWQIRKRPNTAYKLAVQKAAYEVRAYLGARQDEIIKLQSEQTASGQLETTVKTVFDDYLNTRRGRKAKTADKVLSEITGPLCSVLSRRERAYEALIARLSETGAAVLNAESTATPASATDDRAELENRAAGLLIAYCERRIADRQAPSKPSRRRIRKKPALPEPEPEAEINDK